MSSKTVAKAFGYLTDGEVNLLKQMIKKVSEDKNPVVVNIGAGAGTSALAMREANPAIDLYSVDKSEGGPFGGFEGERNAFIEAGLPIPKQRLGDSKQLGLEWTGPTIDLLFIDGDHSAMGVAGDFAAWYGKVSPDGVIIFHDYGSDNWPDVKLFVDNVVKRGIGIELGNVDTMIAFLAS